jgi:hypothetical protein
MKKIKKHGNVKQQKQLFLEEFAPNVELFKQLLRSWHLAPTAQSHGALMAFSLQVHHVEP